MAHVSARVTRVEADPAGKERLTAIRRRVADDVTTAVAGDARRYCPVDTGDLLDSIDSRTLVGRENASPESDGGMVTVGTDHWHETEYGSPAHLIRARFAKALAFPGADGQTVIRKQVHHPGTPEQAFMRPAIFQERELHHE